MTGRYPTRFGHEFNSVAQQAGLVAQRNHDRRPVPLARLRDVRRRQVAPGQQAGISPDEARVRRILWHARQHAVLSPDAIRRFARLARCANNRRSEDFYTTDAYAERAVDWIGKQKKDKPWLLYVPFNAQHAPLQAPEEYLDRFKNIPDEKRRTFAAMMSAMDEAVGKILAKVRDMGEEENTLIFFFSDNGGPTQADDFQQRPAPRLQDRRPGKAARACRSALQWKGTLPAGKTYENPVMNLDILPTALAAAGVEAKPEWKLDGVNLLPYLTGKNNEAAARNAVLAIRRPMGRSPRRLETRRRQRRRQNKRRAVQPGQRHQRIEEPRRRQSGQSQASSKRCGTTGTPSKSRRPFPKRSRADNDNGQRQRQNQRQQTRQKAAA